MAIYFSGSWGALVIIFGEQSHSFGDWGSLQKVKKSHLKRKALISLDFFFFFKNLRLLGGSPLNSAPLENLYVLTFVLSYY